MKKKIVVLGGGIIGLSIAKKLSKDFNVKLYEKEKKIGLHQSGRNSGVLHCGLYYKPNSLKAKLAYNGIRQMVHYCKERKIFYDLCGKLVVANNQEDIKTLENLANNGVLNGLKGLKFLNKLDVIKIEPNIVFSKVLHVPEEGIVDYKSVMENLKNDILNNNGEIFYEYEAIKSNKNEVIFSNGDSTNFDLLFNCTGLYSDKTYTNLTNKKCPIQIIPFRGEYYKLKNKYCNIFNNLVYPTPNSKFPFLGIHFTRMHDGSKEIGPNAVFAFKREGYKRTDISIQETFESISYKGLRQFVFKNFKFVINELTSSMFQYQFLKKAQKIIPDLTIDMIETGLNGVRAQAISESGTLLMDFSIEKFENQIHVLNAPSPGATSSLAIADYIIENYIT